jgi:hypothetical protein
MDRKYRLKPAFPLIQMRFSRRLAFRIRLMRPGIPSFFSHHSPLSLGENTIVYDAYKMNWPSRSIPVNPQRNYSFSPAGKDFYHHVDAA